MHNNILYIYKTLNQISRIQKNVPVRGKEVNSQDEGRYLLIYSNVFATRGPLDNSCQK